MYIYRCVYFVYKLYITYDYDYGTNIYTSVSYHFTDSSIYNDKNDYIQEGKGTD